VQTKIKMPIRAAPYKHQQEAFEFACRFFGLLEKKQASSICENRNNAVRGGDENI